MKHLILTALAIFLLVTHTMAADVPMWVARVGDKKVVELPHMIADIGNADVVFIGDTHDDMELHGRQLQIIRALYAKDRQLAIGLEMFTAEYQKYLDDWTAGKLDEKEFVAIYGKNWSYDWSLYREIFVFARDNHVPMIALNVPKQIIAKVVRQGAKALTEAERAELPPGDPWGLNPRQAYYLSRIRQQVFGNRPSPFGSSNFDDAQALRNHAIAYNVMKFRKKFPNLQVVAIAGTWHAIKNGAPDSLNDYGRCSYEVVLPDLPEFSWLRPTLEDADYLIPRAGSLSPPPLQGNGRGGDRGSR